MDESSDRRRVVAPDKGFRNDLHSEDIDDDYYIDKVLAGDNDAFTPVVQKYETRIRGFCTNMIGSINDIDDAAQDIFLKAFQALSTFRRDSKFSTWLYRVASNHCIDVIRKAKLKRWIFGERVSSLSWKESNIEPLLTDSNVHHANDQYTAIAAKNFALTVLNRLPANYRALIILREVEGLSYEELAETLRCNTESVKSRLKRARRKMLEIKEQIDNETN